MKGVKKIWVKRRNKIANKNQREKLQDLLTDKMDTTNQLKTSCD